MADATHLVYYSDVNYLEPTLVSATSAAVWATEAYPLVIHVVLDRVPKVDVGSFIKRLNAVSPYVTVVGHTWDAVSFEKYPKWHGSTLVYARMMLADMLSQVDWAITVDGDTLWLAHPWELMRLGDDSLWMQASIDPPPPNGLPNPQLLWFRDRGLVMRPDSYFCMGLALLHLSVLRKVKFAKQCRLFLEKYPNPPYCEQMVMCYLAQGHSAALPEHWGLYSVLHCGKDLTQPGLIHYVQDLPWRRDKLNRLFSDIVMLWFEFVRIVFGEDRYHRDFSWFDRWWRRGLFRLLKACPWLLFHPILKRKFRNTAGIPKDMFKAVVDRWAALRRQV